MSKVTSLITTEPLLCHSAEESEYLSAEPFGGENTRELVVEVESVRRVQKRSKTTSLFCEECRSISEFVRLADASLVFEVEIGKLAGFIEANRCHYKQHANGSIYICLLSFMRLMRERTTE
jgi:hypothetical protein